MKVLPVPVARVRDALPVVRDGLHHALYGDVLVVAAGVRAAFVLERHGGEVVAPGVRCREGPRPQLVRGGVGRQLAFLAGLHVDAVDALAVGGVGESNSHLRGVVLRLGDALGQRLVPRLGLVHGELAVAIDQHVVGVVRPRAPAEAFNAARSDGILAQDLAALDVAPARRLQGGINMLGSGIGFVHACPRVPR